MKFSGEQEFELAQDELWQHLTDMSFIGSAIPDLDRVEQVDLKRLVCRVRPRFSFLSGSLKLTFEIIESEPLEYLKVRCRGKGIGAAVEVETEIRLRQKSVMTTLGWQSLIAKREGLLKPVSSGLIQGAAERVIRDFWERFRSALVADSESPDNQ